MQKQLSERTTIIILLVSAIALLVYAVFRALVIPLTHDEAVTFALFVPKSFSDITGYVDSYGMPNNHILNTLLIKFSTGVFGNSPLAVRLPNLIALTVFLYASLRLLREIPSIWIRVGGFILLTCNPFLFDFFCLGRGYGICNAFMMLALWAMFRWFKQPDTKKSILILIFAMLMVLANFATIHLFVGIVCVIAIVNVRNYAAKEYVSFFSSLAIPIASLLLLGGVLYKPFQSILQWNQAIGGTDGFWWDCVLLLVSSSLYGAPGAYTIMQISPYILAVLFVGILLINYFSWKNNKWSFLHCISFLIVATTALIELQHLLLGSDFPLVRSVQFLYPLFILIIIFCLDRINKYAVAVTIFLLLTAVPGALHFVNSAHPDFVQEWKYDAMDRKVLNDLREIAIEEQKQLDVKITWIFEPGLNYERNYQQSTATLLFDREGIERSADYYYVTREDSITLANDGKKVVIYYPLTETSLMK